MNRSFCQAAAFAAAVAVMLPLSAPAIADSSIILRSTRSFDRTAHTATLPLHEGWVDGRPVWYIITDASDVNEARTLGVVYSRISQISACARRNTSSNTAANTCSRRHLTFLRAARMLQARAAFHQSPQARVASGVDIRRSYELKALPAS